MPETRPPFEIIDFHSHYVPERFELTIAKGAPPKQRARWDMLARKMADRDFLLKDIREGRLSARVVNTPVSLVADADGCVPHESILDINDELAELVGRQPGRLHGLATIDAYDGDRSAREVERAVRDLGLRGIFVDCARGDAMIDAPPARPTLDIAARLGVPVFVHPVAPEPLTRQMTPYGLIGTLFARGTVNAAAVIALVEGGTFTQLPGLRIVVTALALGGLATAANFSQQSLLPSGAIEVMRKHVFVDTMGFHPALIRASVDILGAENVVAGSDWPILSDGPIDGILADAMQRAGLSGDQQEAIAGRNSRRLLGLN